MANNYLLNLDDSGGVANTPAGGGKLFIDASGNLTGEMQAPKPVLGPYLSDIQKSVPTPTVDAPFIGPKLPEQKSTPKITDNGGFDASDYAKELGYGSTGEAKRALGISSLEDYRKRSQGIIDDIGASYNPIFQALDAQLGRLDPEKQELLSGIETQAMTQQESARAAAEASKQTLETQKERGLRDLAGDIRNQLTAAGRAIGLAGAGSSSAVGQASEAVLRAGQQARSDLLQKTQEQLTNIENVAVQELGRINQWKNDRMFEISQFFQSKFADLQDRKAQASANQKQNIAQLEMNLETDYFNQLRQLDAEIRDYNLQVEKWKQSSADKAMSNLSALERYGAESLEAQNEALNIFNDLIARGADEDYASQLLEAQGYIIPDRAREEDPFTSGFYGSVQQQPNFGVVGLDVDANGMPIAR